MKDAKICAHKLGALSAGSHALVSTHWYNGVSGGISKDPRMSCEGVHLLEPIRFELKVLLLFAFVVQPAYINVTSGVVSDVKKTPM